MPATLSAVLACSLAVLTGGPGAAGSAAPSFDAEAYQTKLAELEPRTGLPTGWVVPDGKLQDVNGKPVSLYELIDKAEGPVVLIFYRGGWCPFCMRHLADLGKHADDFKKLGATVIAVSPESFENLETTTDKADLDKADYTLVSDPEHTLIKRFNLIFDVDAGTQEKYKGYGIDLEKWNADGQWKLPVPAAFVVDKDKKIVFRHVDENYRKRVNVKLLLKAIKDAD